MEVAANEPKTLQEAILFFANPENCLNYLVARRWANGVVCPTCGSDKVSFLKNQLRWQCSSHHAKRQFSVKVGTIFEDSPLGLDKWLPCVWLLTNCKNGISSYEIGKDLGVTQKTAWFMLQRIRLAHQGKTGGKLSGEVEIDETFIGGKSRNMHKAKRARVITGTGGRDKEIVMGMLERGGNVRVMHIENRRKSELQRQVREHVEAGAAIFTDELLSYDGLDADYKHAVINHAIEYANENTHTNGMENFWSLLKRCLQGTYISVEPFHLFRYIDEQVFRFNNRSLTDGERFDLAVREIVGKRLTLCGTHRQGAGDGSDPLNRGAESAALSGRIDLWFGSASFRVRGRLFLVSADAPRNCGVRDGKQKSYLVVETFESFCPLVTVR